MYSRLIYSFAFSCALLLGQSGDTPAMTRLREERAKIQQLVDAGALPRTALEKLDTKLLEAKDDEILRETLYGKLAIEDLTEDQADQMTAAANRQVERQQDKIRQAEKLVDAGVASRSSLEPLTEELDRRKLTVDLAAGRARLLKQLAEMVRTEEALEASVQRTPEDAGSAVGGPVAERYDGDGSFTDRDFKKVAKAYEGEFERPLPVSARGETALHRSLGFDHRGRVDVALNPDQEEGRWLRHFLESAKIPYFAFRRAVPGKATAAHIHIGPPSNRLHVSD